MDLSKKELAGYLTIQYDYDKIADILKFKEKLPESPKGVDEKVVHETFGEYMRRYSLNLVTYLDAEGTFLKDVPNIELALAYRGDISYYANSDKWPHVVLENENSVGMISAFKAYAMEHEKEIRFCVIQQLDDTFSLATFYCKGEAVLKILGRTKTIIHNTLIRTSSVVATVGEEWFSNSVRDVKLEDAKNVHAILYAIPGKSGCKCNALIKKCWYLADSVNDFLDLDSPPRG